MKKLIVLLVLIEGTSIKTEDNSTIYSEGKKIYKIHVSYERDSALAKLKKRNILDKTGSLTCEVCNFDFHKTFGERGFDSTNSSRALWIVLELVSPLQPFLNNSLYLTHSRHQIWYYQRWIAIHFRKHNPKLKKLFRVSLHTSNFSKAKIKSGLLSVKIDELALKYFDNPKDFGEGMTLGQP